MIKFLLFDCGGVFQAPLAGEWILSPGYREILNRPLRADEIAAFNGFVNDHLELLPEALLLKSEEEEEAAYRALYARAFAAAGVRITAEQAAAMSRDTVYRDDRNYNYDDVLPWLSRWHGLYRIGLISDATPSSRRMVHNTGIAAYLDSETYSYELGSTKPGERIFKTALSALGAPAEATLFIDDSPVNLGAAAALGLKCVQMRRRAGAPKTAKWDGPAVSDMEELNTYLSEIDGGGEERA